MTHQTKSSRVWDSWVLKFECNRTFSWLLWSFVGLLKLRLFNWFDGPDRFKRAPGDLHDEAYTWIYRFKQTAWLWVNNYNSRRLVQCEHITSWTNLAKTKKNIIKHIGTLFLNKLGLDARVAYFCPTIQILRQTLCTSSNSEVCRSAWRSTCRRYRFSTSYFFLPSVHGVKVSPFRRLCKTL